MPPPNMRASLVDEGFPVMADYCLRARRVKVPGVRLALLTRDSRRYRTYYPKLRLIAPD
jgi:hypothetical protein